MATGTAIATRARTDQSAPSLARWNALFVGLSIAQGALLLTAPSVTVIALGLWWNTNTIGHNFIHRPFFRSRTMNRIYSVYLTLLIGVPQQLWRERHLAHHAGRRPRLRMSTALAIELTAVAALWATIATLLPRTFLQVYLPGWALGLALCQVHGYYEHARGTTSHYGRLYNVLFFNDGFHVEHHARPHAHWTTLPAAAGRPARATSRWPAVLRWIDALNLTGLERMVVRSPRLQRFVLGVHERAFRALLPDPERFDRITIVGGALFPRTALVLSRVAPHARVTIVDACADHIETARKSIDVVPGTTRLEFRCETFDPSAQCDADLVIVPLAFEGDRQRLYRQPPAPTMLVHDWIWARHGTSVVISWLLLKRLNLVQR